MYCISLFWLFIISRELGSNHSRAVSPRETLQGEADSRTGPHNLEHMGIAARGFIWDKLFRSLGLITFISSLGKIPPKAECAYRQRRYIA